MRTLTLLSIAFLLAFAVPAQAFLGLFGSTETVAAKDGLVTLDVSKLANGDARHYLFREGKTQIRFFVARDAQGVVRAALDACEVCWKENKGYKLESGAMLCVNCGRKFALNRIGEARGGCNPHPIAFTCTDGTFSVAASELLAGAKFYPENK